jgi:HSP20 family protein
MAIKDFISRKLPVLKQENSNPFLTLQQEMNNVFNRFSDNFLSPFRNEPWSTYPKVNIKESKNEIEVTAELPGLDKKDIEISISDNVLTLKGEKRLENETKENNYYKMERSYGAFNRVITLPADVKTDKTNAEFKNGILKITISKKPESEQKAKKIDIKTA